ncbi:MAG TPA: helical backbone metal receptor [Saprospiraceae bacterium]|nr:helical backbone metal receptor [Saprospiraceae bacterium]HMP25767.1 helical backbone metal receptor [Saprospiraceae bacterium]
MMLRHFIDQMHRPVLLEYPPRRIVSLVPSQTELLYNLGLREEVVGITKFCIHPESWFRSKTRVGGTKNVHFERITALDPDLIIGNKEENTRTDIEQLAQQYPVWMSDIYTLDDALRMIREVGALVGRAEVAQRMAAAIAEDFVPLQWPMNAVQPRAAYFIWRKPYMVAATNTFINEMLQRAGFVNVFAHRQRYPEVTFDELTAARPDVVLLSSEPYPFQEKHFAEIRQVCPAAVIKIVDGTLFSWYGSRLSQSAAYFQQLQAEIRKSE